MSNNNFTITNWRYTSIAMLLIAVMAMLLFQTEDKLQLCLLLLTVCIGILRPLPFRQWTAIDIYLSLITIYDIISCLYTNCPVSAVHRMLLSLLCLTVYFLSRKIFASEHATQIFQQGSYLPIGAALLLAVCSFFIFRQSVLNANFEDTYHFRFLFRPLGYTTNVWAEVLLILLGWVCLIRRYSSPFIFLTVLAILFSFSRGAYIALGIYIFAWLLFVRTKQEKLRLLTISMVAIILTGISFPNEMKTTLQMNRTVSQQQSTKGRVNATQAGWDTFKQYPLFGYGNGNYTFAVDQTLNQDSTLPYTSFAPNILMQLLIEKGIIGILLYLLLALAVCHKILKRRKQPESYMIGCLFLALAGKEMTQATLLNTPFALFMLYILLAFLQKEKNLVETESKQTASTYIIPGFIACCYLGWLAFFFVQYKNKSYQEQSVTAWEKNQTAEAIYLMEQTNEQIPNLVNKGLLYLECYRKTQAINYLNAADQAINQAYNKQPEDLQILYLQTQVYMLKQDTDKAYTVLRKLATDYPKNSLYLVSLSDILYQKGEKEEALQVLANAIRHTPRLLTGSRILKLQQTDTVFYKALSENLLNLKPTQANSPADFARYGYIAQRYGHPVIAKEYLLKATEELPNLATPWHLLGDDRKYRLLIFGAFRKDLSSSELPEEKEMSDDLLFKMTYQSKFKNWYGSELIP